MVIYIIFNLLAQLAHGGKLIFLYFYRSVPANQQEVYDIEGTEHEDSPMSIKTNKRSHGDAFDEDDFNEWMEERSLKYADVEEQVPQDDGDRELRCDSRLEDAQTQDNLWYN